MATEDTVLTRITEARTDALAQDYVRQVKPSVLRKVADLLYIELYDLDTGHDLSTRALRAAIVKEARA